MRKLLKTLLALVVLAGVATGVYAYSRGGKKADVEMKLVFTDLWNAGGTLIVITHDMSLARRAGRLIEVHDGRILSDSAAEAA